MKRIVAMMAGMALIGGCSGGGASAVGANSADSITTTAVGNVVATIPSPTPTPSETPTEAPAAIDTNAAAPASDTVANAAAAEPQ